MKTKQLPVSLVLALLIAVIIVNTALAYSKNVWYYNYVGSSDAKGTVSVNNGETKWTAKIQSKIVNPQTSINVIGRTWWTVRELCEATWTQNFQYGGAYKSGGGSSYSASKSVTKQHCTGMRFGRSMGGHDFNHTGVPRWQPTNDTHHVQVP